MYTSIYNFWHIDCQTNRIKKISLTHQPNYNSKDASGADYTSLGKKKLLKKGFLIGIYILFNWFEDNVSSNDPN